MQAWIFSDETYCKMYYELYAEMLDTVDIQGIIDNTYNLIAPYVQKDPSAFCTYEQFETGVQTMKDFCSLRTESVALQLAGSNEMVNAGNLNISSMGTMGGGFGGRGDNSTSDRIPGSINGSQSGTPSGSKPSTSGSTGGTRPSMGGNTTSGSQMPWGNTANGGFTGNIPNDFTGNIPSDFAGNIPNGFDGTLPEGFTGTFPEDFAGMMPEGFTGNIPSNFTGNWPSDFGGNMPNGNMPSGNGGNTNRPSMGSSTQQPASTNDSSLLIVSIAVLIAGIVFAALFQRRKRTK